MASGRIEYVVSSKGLTLYIDWVSTPSATENKSTIDTKVYLKYYTLTVGSRANNYIEVEGQRVGFVVPAISHSGSWQTLLINHSIFDVAHNADGSKLCNIKALYNITITGLSSMTAEQNVYLDQLDTSPPSVSFSLSNITGQGFSIFTNSNVNCDYWEYSLDYGNSWITFWNASTTAASITLSSLNANQSYVVSVRVRKTSNKLYGYSGVSSVKTLPIYITSISASDKNINEGSSVSFGATISPSNASIKTLNCSSSNTAIATVSSSGVILAKSKGTATITANSTDGSNVSKSITVTVKKPVTGVTINQSANLQASETYQLAWSVLPSTASDLSVSFVSSDTDVATVSNTGLITGVAIGSCTVTVTTTDGNYSATCNVEVTGDIAWQPIEPLNYLAWWDVNTIYNDCLWIRQKLIEKEITVGALTKPNVDAEYSVLLTDIKSIFNTIESNISILNQAIPWSSIYYDTLYEWQDINTDKKSKVNRWIMFINDCYSVFTGVTQPIEFLLDENSEQITDKNGDIIYCYGNEV